MINRIYSTYNNLHQNIDKYLKALKCRDLDNTDVWCWAIAPPTMRTSNNASVETWWVLVCYSKTKHGTMRTSNNASVETWWVLVCYSKTKHGNIFEIFCTCTLITNKSTTLLSCVICLFTMSSHCQPGYPIMCKLQHVLYSRKRIMQQDLCLES